MPPLSDPLTIRLPDELVTWLDGQVKAGVYKNRSEAIREIVDCVSQSAPEVKAVEGAMLGRMAGEREDREPDFLDEIIADSEAKSPGFAARIERAVGERFRRLTPNAGTGPLPRLNALGGPYQPMESEERDALTKVLQLPWFMIPLRFENDVEPGYGSSGRPQVPTRPRDFWRLPPSRDLIFWQDRLVAPERFVPFGLWSDDPACGEFMVEDLKINGGADLMEGRPTPLTLATETSWKNGLPSRLTLDPENLHVCKGNITVVTLRRAAGERPAARGEWAAGIAKRLERRLMIWSAPEEVANGCAEATELEQSHGVLLRAMVPQSAKGSVEFLSLRELFASSGVDLARLLEVLESHTVRTEPLRLALLAVAPEHVELLRERLSMSSKR